MEFPPLQVGRIVKGRKLADIDPLETMEFELKLRRAKKLLDEKRRIELDIEENSVWLRKWWLEIRRKYNIEMENVTFDEGGVYEGKIEGQ